MSEWRLMPIKLPIFLPLARDLRLFFHLLASALALVSGAGVIEPPFAASEAASLRPFHFEDFGLALLAHASCSACAISIEDWSELDVSVGVGVSAKDCVFVGALELARGL